MLRLLARIYTIVSTAGTNISSSVWSYLVQRENLHAFDNYVHRILAYIYSFYHVSLIVFFLNLCSEMILHASCVCAWCLLPIKIMACHVICLPILMHSIRHRPFLMVSRMSSRWLNVFVLVLGSLSRPRYPLVRAGRVHDMLLLKVRMRATRGHILQEVVMHVIGIILEKHCQKNDY